MDEHLGKKLADFTNLFQRWQDHSIVLHFFDKFGYPRSFLRVTILQSTQ